MALKKVLICDDSPTDLANLSNALKGADCVLLTADSGEKAVQLAKSEKPDIIFLDIIMPGMDGFATCRVLREDPATKHIPVYFVSTKNQKADRVWAQMQGAKDLISKPYNPSEIVKQLNAV